MNTSARMLRLLSLLQTHRFCPGGELGPAADERLDHLEGDEVVMAMRVDDFFWPLAVLASIPAAFRVEEPPQLRELVAEVGARFAQSRG